MKAVSARECSENPLNHESTTCGLQPVSGAVRTGPQASHALCVVVQLSDDKMWVASNALYFHAKSCSHTPRAKQIHV